VLTLTFKLQFHVNTLTSLGQTVAGQHTFITRKVVTFCGYASFNGLAWDLQCGLCHIVLYYHIKCYVCTKYVFVIHMSIGLFSLQM